MSTYGEYTTLTDYKAYQLPNSGTGDDTLLLSLIREASRMIDSSAKVGIAGFTPRIDTKYYNVPGGERGIGYLKPLYFRDAFLLELTTLTNGDGNAIASASYKLTPANATPKNSVSLKPSTGTVWQPDSGGNVEQVISVLGVWGFHQDYANAWVATGNTVNGAHTSSTTSLAFTGGVAMKPGSLLKIGSEYLYQSAGTTTPLTVVRGVNGSTAAAMNGGETIYVWTVDNALSGLCRRAAAALFALRNNPTATAVIFEGMRIETPQDVQQFIDKNIDCLGTARVVTG